MRVLRHTDRKKLQVIVKSVSLAMVSGFLYEYLKPCLRNCYTIIARLIPVLFLGNFHEQARQLVSSAFEIINVSVNYYSMYRVFRPFDITKI